MKKLFCAHPNPTTTFSLARETPETGELSWHIHLTCPSCGATHTNKQGRFSFRDKKPTIGERLKKVRDWLWHLWYSSMRTIGQTIAFCKPREKVIHVHVKREGGDFLPCDYP